LEHLGGGGKGSWQNKSEEIRDLVKAAPISSEWTLPSLLKSNPVCFERS